MNNNYNTAVRAGGGGEALSPERIERQWATTAPTTEANYGGIYTSGQADLYGIPAMIIDAMTAPNSIVDLFGPPRFNNQPLAPYELLTQSGPANDNDTSFQEGSCPGTTSETRNRFALVAGSFGVCTPRTTYVALASKQNNWVGARSIVTREGTVEVSTEWEYQLYTTLRAARTGLEWLIINGDPTNNPFNFEGLDRAIRAPSGGRLDVLGNQVTQANSVVYNLNGSRVTVDLLNDMIASLENNYVWPGDIVMLMSAGMANEIARIIALNWNDPGAKRQEILQNKTFPLYGFEIPFRTSQWIASTATGNTREYMSTIYFITTQYLGVDSMWLEYYDFSELVLNTDLFANPYGQMGAQPGSWYMIPRDHGDYCTATSYCLFAHGRLYYRAPQSLGRFNNATYQLINERVLT